MRQQLDDRVLLPAEVPDPGAGTVVGDPGNPPLLRALTSARSQRAAVRESPQGSVVGAPSVPQRALTSDWPQRPSVRESPLPEDQLRALTSDRSRRPSVRVSPPSAVGSAQNPPRALTSASPRRPAVRASPQAAGGALPGVFGGGARGLGPVGHAVRRAAEPGRQAIVAEGPSHAAPCAWCYCGTLVFVEPAGCEQNADPQEVRHGEAGRPSTFVSSGSDIVGPARKTASSRSSPRPRMSALAVLAPQWNFEDAEYASLGRLESGKSAPSAPDPATSVAHHASHDELE